MEKKTFFAHSTANTSRSDWQPWNEHSDGVGNIAGKFAAIFDARNFAELAGRLHDLGKCTEEFLLRLSGKRIKVDHSTHGALFAKERYGKLGLLLAYVIAGHHAGLPNGMNGEKRTALHDRLRHHLPPFSEGCQNIELPDAQTLKVSFQVVEERRWFQIAFFVRMIFSCVVDADYLDTEAFYDKVEGKSRALARRAEMPSLEALRERLDVHLSHFRANSELNQIRAKVLTHVRRKAVEYSPGLFSLTVPTGGGKTFASLAFALDHAIENGLRRVIFVIPFTSVVEQNADVFREALGDLGENAVLEHHSAYIAQNSQDEQISLESREKLKLAMENWDVPIVVTTAVQFFESLFSASTAQCRKLHNIAGSVVILDEAQTLPIHLLRPTVAAIDELARNYRVSIVLCTATQPALKAENLSGGLENVREIAPYPQELFRKLERVKVRHIGILDDAGLTAYMRRNEQVLCIVNNRRHARSVFQSMADLSGARHLTTLMCAKHRSVVLKEIRRDLKDGKPCRLVSTSLIEAGVDVDFPLVLRAEAGLDSIAQAAGRCNREGKRKAASSEVLVFAPANNDWKPPTELKQSAQAAKEVFRKTGFQENLLSPAAIQTYFKELYWTKGEAALDTKALLKLLADSQIDSLPLETLATEFRMIDTAQLPVIVPWNKEARQALEKLRYADKIGGFARKLQPYLVQVSRQGVDALLRSGTVQPVAPEKWGNQFMELLRMERYDPCSGLQLEEEWEVLMW